MTKTVIFTRLTPTARVPVYATPGAAGMDLFADEDLVVKPHTRALVKTNIAIQLPFDLEAQIRPRSGLALKRGITVLNSPGTIDSDYRGPIGVVLYNSSFEPFEIHRGDRIAQMVIASYQRVLMEERSVLSDTARGAGGFGSTGAS